MSLSLKDQLIKAGLLKGDKAASGAKTFAKAKSETRIAKGGGLDAAQVSLANAYQAREAAERKERVEAQLRAETAARERKARKTQLKALIEGKALNLKDCEQIRHFEYGGKIRRLYVSCEQLVQINAGQLGIVQVDGRFQLLEASLVAQAQLLAPELVALHGIKAEPMASEIPAEYADPKFQVPDDLSW